MSREIKFRVMDVDGNWHYHTLGDFVCHTPMPEQLKPETWTQYTGLKDKNGVEIYEGDIVAQEWIKKDRYDSGEFVYGVIKFVECCFVEAYKISERQEDVEKIDGENCIVVGNIYQNPELLK